MNADNPLWLWLARAGLCLAFLYSGVAKLLDFPGAIEEQAHFGLRPAGCSPLQRSSFSWAGPRWCCSRAVAPRHSAPPCSRDSLCLRR